MWPYADVVRDIVDAGNPMSCLLRGHPSRPGVECARQCDDALLHFDAHVRLSNPSIPPQLVEDIPLNPASVFLLISFMTFFRVVAVAVNIYPQQSSFQPARRDLP